MNNNENTTESGFNLNDALRAALKKQGHNFLNRRAFKRFAEKRLTQVTDKEFGCTYFYINYVNLNDRGKLLLTIKTPDKL